MSIWLQFFQVMTALQVAVFEHYHADIASKGSLQAIDACEKKLKEVLKQLRKEAVT